MLRWVNCDSSWWAATVLEEHRFELFDDDGEFVGAVFGKPGEWTHEEAADGDKYRTVWGAASALLREVGIKLLLLPIRQAQRETREMLAELAEPPGLREMLAESAEPPGLSQEALDTIAGVRALDELVDRSK